MSDVYTKGPFELRLGRYQDVLADVECDAVITDPPYSKRTHGGQRHGRRKSGSGKWCSTRAIPYQGWEEKEIGAFCARWTKSKGWTCVMTSHDLCPKFESELQGHGRYVFAPLPCVQIGMNVRLAGDGPSSWTVWLVVARPRHMPYSKWGTLRGAYVGGQDQERKRGLGVVGGKPLWLMRAIVRDYSRPGDLICDPCAGGGTTLLAAAMEGRKAIGAEMDPATYELACKRFEQGWTKSLFCPGPDAPPPKHVALDLFGEDGEAESV